MGGKVADSEYPNGKPVAYDPSFKGPIKNRSCTDILCCILFVVFFAGQIVVAFFAYAYGNPKVLLYPEDSDGNLCGFGSQRGKDELFFFDLVQCGRMGPGVFVNGCPTPQVCVSKCPTKNFVWLQNLPNSKDELICKYKADKSKSLTDLVKDDDCASWYLKSETVLHRCLPITDLLDLTGKTVSVVTDKGTLNLTSADSTGVSGEAVEAARKTLQQFVKAKEYGEKIIADVVTSWWMILLGLLLAMIVSFLWIVVMRWVAGFMVWLAIIAFIGIFGFGTGFLLYQYYIFRDSDEVYTIDMSGLHLTFKKSDFFLGTGITCGILFTIVLLIFCFLWQRIRIAIALIKEGSRAVGTMMFTLLWPIFPFLFQIVFVGFWAACAVFLASIGRNQQLGENNITFPNGTVNEDAVKAQTKDLFNQVPCETNTNDTLGDVCGFLKNGKGDYTIYLQIYNLFMAFWLVNFVVAFGQMALAGAFASFYWAYNKPDDIPSFPLLASIWRCFRYHLGTLAFGSFIIAVVQIIRVFLEYLDHKLKGSENPVAKFFLKCLKCCFWCLEKFLKFLNKNAYIMCAIYGKNFCTSAKNAFFLILRNIVRVVVIDKVTDFLLFIGKLVVVGGVGCAAFFFFDGRIPFLKNYNPTLNFYLVPIVIVIVGTYIIATCFFSVYGMAVDTLFLCFLEDLERNDGSAEKPYYMNKSLMKILGKKNVMEKKE